MFTQKSFYKSDKWLKFRQVIISERVNPDDGFVYCALCEKPIVNKYDLIIHHKIELNDINANDYNISLNPDKVECVHFRCHNQLHDRWQGGNNGWKPPAKKVYIVYGSPCSGKSSWVRSVATDRDLICDLDSIWESIGIVDRYEKPDSLKSVVFTIRDKLYEIIKYRSGNWDNAYVINTGALKGERERLMTRLGADECIFIDTPKEVCLERASDRPDEWTEYINDFFEKYQP